MASTKTLMISMAIATHAIQVAGKHNDIGLQYLVIFVVATTV